MLGSLDTSGYHNISGGDYVSLSKLDMGGSGSGSGDNHNIGHIHLQFQA